MLLMYFSQPLLQVQSQGSRNDRVDFTDPLSACLLEHGSLHFFFFIIMIEDWKISLWDIFSEVTAPFEPDRATWTADSRAEYAANVRPLVVNKTCAVVVKSRALHFG